jgi:hypothetical protein
VFKPIRIVRVTFVSVALVLVSGCASYWLKPGATRQSFNDDKAHCMAQGYLVAPITNTPVPMGGGYAAPGSATCVEHGNTADCAGYPGTHLPPTAVPVDMNTHARSAVVDACMRGLGYTRVDLGIGGGAATITQAPVVGAGSTSEETLQPIPGE